MGATRSILTSAGLAIVSMYAGCSLFSQIVFNLIVPNAVVDEKFHVNQVQQYCRGNWSYWNPKITTPPGLYVVTVMFVQLLRPLEVILGGSFCTLYWCRFVSQICMTLLLIVTTCVGNGGRRSIQIRHWLNGLSIVTCPILFFYGFLYYTDVVSLLTVAAMYSMMQRRRRWMGAFFGLLSIVCRQSNIVWVFFVAAADMVTFHEVKMVIRSVRIENVWKLFKAAICRLGGYIIVAILFMYAVYLNRGFTLGDKDAHGLCLHAPQFFYFLALSVIVSPSILISKWTVVAFYRNCQKHTAIYAACILAAVILIRHFTYAHPYLLADNRHITFYIWRRWFLRHDACKYLLIPLYVFGFYSMTYMVQKNGIPWTVLFWLCTVVSLVLNRLVEIRYFIVPYFIWRISIPPVNRNVVIADGLLHVVLNVFLFTLFFSKTFSWPDEQYPQRIML